MNTYTVKIENITGLSSADQNALRNLQYTAGFTSLDAAEELLKKTYGPRGWFIYRGGSHVALHGVAGGVRILIVEEREVPVEKTPAQKADLAARIAGSVRAAAAVERPVYVAPTVDAALAIAYPTPPRTTPEFASLTAAVAVARNEARLDAVRHGRKLTDQRGRPQPAKFVRSRGVQVYVLGAHGRVKQFEEAVQWDGTKRELVAIVARAQAIPEATEVVLGGGFDLAYDITFDDYEPEVSEWSLVVWRRAAGYVIEHEVAR